jgi:hypothetical protein
MRSRVRGHRVQSARPALGLEDLIAAPELAAFELLGQALQVATLAALAQYPHLLGDESGRVRHDGDPLATIAESLLDAMAQLRAVLDWYRRAALDARHRDDDLPF